MPRKLRVVQEIVSDASEVALAAFNSRSQLSLGSKGPHDFVTEADKAVEQLVRARIRGEFPQDEVLGEEAGRSGEETSEARWFIDPIDGTTNFLRGLPWWGVSLGLALSGRPRIGVIAFPALDLIVSAATGFGMFMNGRPVKRDALFSGVQLVSVGDSDEDLDESLELTSRLRRAGWMVQSYRCTTLGLAFSALGKLDGHLQHRVRPWDIAAGLVLCSEAGLTVRHGPLGKGFTWVSAATPALHEVCASSFDGRLAQVRGMDGA